MQLKLGQQELKFEVANSSYLMEQLNSNMEQLSQMIDDKKGEPKGDDPMIAHSEGEPDKKDDEGKPSKDGRSSSEGEQEKEAGSDE